MTVQSKDLLRYGGKTYAIDVTPLEGLWENAPTTRPKIEFRVTSNWRGYVATWRIEPRGESASGLHLVLEWIAGAIIDSFEASHLTVLGYDEMQCDGNEKIVAHWFTGEINAGRGDLLFSHLSRTTKTLSAEMLHITIEKGIVTSLQEARYDASDVERLFPKPPPIDEATLPHFLRRRRD